MEQGLENHAGTSKASDPTPSTSEAGASSSWGQIAADVAVNPISYLVAIVLCVLFVNQVGDSNIALLILAALPVVGLTALSKSSAGKQVQDDLERKLPGARAHMNTLKAIASLHNLPASTAHVDTMYNSLFASGIRCALDGAL